MASSDQLLFEELLNSSSMQQLEMLLTSGQVDPNVFDPNFPDMNDLQSILSNTSAQTPGGFSPASLTERLEVIAQPYYGKKLRYRSDYEDEATSRLGCMKNRTPDSSYLGPAIRIPSTYLNADETNYIRVSLVTVRHVQTGCQYIHPYELEHPSSEESNDRPHNAVWFPIQGEDFVTGIKSFPSLRIVKKKAEPLKSYGPLRVFDTYDPNESNHAHSQESASPKDIIREYSLNQSQLAFTVAHYRNVNGQDTMCISPETTVFSQAMIEGAGKGTEADNTSPTATSSSQTPARGCRVARYAPKYGFAQSQEEMIVVMTQKVEQKKYKDLKVTFQSQTGDGVWSAEVTELTMKDRILSFKTPLFPNLSDKTTAVDINISLNDQLLEQLKYFYLDTLNECSNCQRNALINTSRVIPNTPNKRSTTVMLDNQDETDGVVPTSEPASALRQSVSQSEGSATTAESRFASLPPMHLTEPKDDEYEKLLDKIIVAVVSLFADNDNKPLFRLSRPLLKRKPQTLHQALDNDHLSLMVDFIPLASLEILQARNERGETLLLHAIRLNRINVVQALMDSKHAPIIVSDVDNEKNNIFHILASNTNASDLLDLVIQFLETKNTSTPIGERFDQPNESGCTPLQVSVCQNNLLATQRLFKYSKTKICLTRNLIGDSLVHLAVRHADLTMIKYLIEEGDLFQQGNQSNLTMTPIELARSLKRQDMVEYFEQKYPRDESEDDDSSDDDESQSNSEQ